MSNSLLKARIFSPVDFLHLLPRVSVAVVESVAVTGITVAAVLCPFCCQSPVLSLWLLLIVPLIELRIDNDSML